VNKIEFYGEQYVDIEIILNEHPLEQKTKKRLQQEKIKIEKTIKNLMKTYRREK
jgi:hypothetical protein